MCTFCKNPDDRLTQKGGGQTFTELISQMVDGKHVYYL